MVFNLGPVIWIISFSLVSQRFQKIRETGETTTSVGIAGTRCKYNVANKIMKEKK